jgi:hypothetical protein
MTTVRQRAARFLRAAAFAALLLVPVVESGHRHATDAPNVPCSVCVVVHHAPIAFATVVAVAATEVSLFSALVSITRAPAAVERRTVCGRAPPSSSLVTV